MTVISHVRPSSPATEVLRLGPLTVRILASGSHTSTVLLTISPHTPGFPLHYHCMHQVNCFILRGTARFVTSRAPGSSHVAKAGEFVEVPAGAKYGFSNPTANETEMLVTYSPGYYVDCLRELAKHCEGGKSMTAEEQAQIVRGWATVVVGKSGKESEGDAMETDEDDETEAGERLGPRYTGLRCMA